MGKSKAIEGTDSSRSPRRELGKLFDENIAEEKKTNSENRKDK